MSSGIVDDGVPLEKFLAALARTKTSRDYSYDHLTGFLTMKTGPNAPNVLKLKDVIPKGWIMHFGITYGIPRHEFWKKA